VRIFCFGLGYSALHFLEGQQSVEASGTVRDAGRARALERDGVAAAVFDGARVEPAIAPHLAAAEALLVSIAPGAEDPVLARFAGAIRAAKSLRAIVYLSTIGVYGDHGGAWVDEASAAAPRSERGRARLAAEEQWRALGASTGVAVHILRLAGIYGPGRNLLIKLRQGGARRIAKPAFEYHLASLNWLRTKHGQTGMTTRLNVRRGATFEECVEGGLAIAGNPDTVRRAIERQAVELGVNYLLTYLFFGTLSFADASRSLALFSREVMPALQSV